MVGVKRFVKQTQYPQPHDMYLSVLLNGDTANKNCTIFPAITHDEAMLASGKNTHPEHASFAETDAANCCAESKIFRIETTMTVTLTKGALSTDEVVALKFAFMTIHSAFEDLDAKDELTSATVGSVLELTSETTDRQTYPIYDTNKLTERYSGSGTVDAAHENLTTNQILENVAFDPDLYYDALNYYTISDKLKKVQDGLRWMTLTRDKPKRIIKFMQKPNTKSMNPYTFLGHMIYLPLVGTKYSHGHASDMTNINHIEVTYRNRFLEWNDNFQHQRA